MSELTLLEQHVLECTQEYLDDSSSEKTKNWDVFTNNIARELETTPQQVAIAMNSLVLKGYVRYTKPNSILNPNLSFEERRRLTAEHVLYKGKYTDEEITYLTMAMHIYKTEGRDNVPAEEIATRLDIPLADAIRLDKSINKKYEKEKREDAKRKAKGKTGT